MWKSCRKQDKDLREMMYQARKRAERKKEMNISRFSDPLQSLRIANCGYEIISDSALYNQSEAGYNLMPWGGDTSKMMDKYDGRALIADVPKWESIKTPPQPKDSKIDDSILNFERYYLLVEAERLGIPEPTVLRAAGEELPDLLLKSAPTHRDGERAQHMPPKQKQAPARANNNIKYDYDGRGGVPEATDHSHTNTHTRHEEPEPEPQETHVQLIEEATEEQEPALNELAKGFGIDHYCRLVRRENRSLIEEQNKSQGDEKGGSKLNRKERRKVRGREKRRSDKAARSSPSYGQRKNHSGSSRSSRSSSGSDDLTPGKFITEFRTRKKKKYSDSDDSDDSSSDDENAQGTEFEIKEATDLKDETTAVIRKPGDRWNFARAIDEKFNQPKYKLRPSSDGKKLEDKVKELKPQASEKVDRSKETPQERLRRKTRQRLNQKIKEDHAQLERKSQLEASERRKREEDLFDYNYGLKRRSPDYNRSDRSNSRSPKRSRRSDSRSRDSFDRDKRKSPDRKKTRSPDRKRSPTPDRKKTRSRTPERRRRSRTPERRRSRTPPERRKSRSPERRRRSKSPDRRRTSRSRSPADRKRSRTPDRRRSRSPPRRSRSPLRRSRTPPRRSRTPPRRSRTPPRRSRSRSWSPRRRSRTPERKRRSRSPDRRRSRSRSWSPRRRSQTPERRRKSYSSSPTRYQKNRSPPSKSTSGKKRQRSRSGSREPPKKITKEKEGGVRKSKYDRLMEQLSQLESKKKAMSGSGPSLSDYNLPSTFH